MDLNIGDKVIMDTRVDSLPWLTKRIAHGYLHLTHQGTIIGFTAAKDKAAIECPERIWDYKKDGQRSSFDNGCHGKGKLGHCIYIPVEYLHPTHTFTCTVHPIHPDQSNTDTLIIC